MVYLKTNEELEQDINKSFWTYIILLSLGLLLAMFGVGIGSTYTICISIFMVLLASIAETQRNSELIRLEIRNLKESE